MCGGCLVTRPGSLWRRLADQAEDLADAIGSNDPAAANIAYNLAGRFNQKWHEATKCWH